MANRIQNKRSSIEGRRPDGSYLEPGELALNTNAKDPGLFFEANDGSILKAGPAYVGKVQPYTEVGFGNGETWFDSASNAINVWSAEADKWLKNIASPYGGTNEVVYVGSSFPEASDDVGNDGTSRPFATLNRAVIEITRRSILSSRNDAPVNNKFVIFLLPGENIVYNEPGVFSDTFKSEVAPFAETDTVTPEIFRKFNSEAGGLVLPRGCSIIGFDSSKTFIRPVSYPKWNRADYLFSPATVEPRANILNWTGNSNISGVSFIDKKDGVTITDIQGDMAEIATLTTLYPHGFRSLEVEPDESEETAWMKAGDIVSLTYPNDVFLNNEGFDSVPAGEYVVEPITPKTFYLRRVIDGSYVLRRNLPNAPSANTSPALWGSISINLTTHHRLSVVGYANETELSQFYTKIQHAYSGLVFGGVSDDAQILGSETIITSPLPITPIPGIDKVENTGARMENCAVLSERGMCGVNIDGSQIQGLKSASVFDSRFVLFQNDPDVYDVYYDGQWIPLKEATWRGTKITEDQVTDRLALTYLINNVMSENLRFFYGFELDEDNKSSGLPFDESDTRHYAVQSRFSSNVNCDSLSITGASIAILAKEGSNVQLRDSEIALGIQSLRAEGFAGIDTLGGADDVHVGFEVQGIRRPVTITKQQLADPRNHVRLFLNSNLRAVTETTLVFESALDLDVIHPYSLKAGDAIWVQSADDDTVSQAILASPPVSSDKKTINVLSAGNEIFAHISDVTEVISPPYIRRFVDPRPEIQRGYALWVKNTNTKHQAPEPGSILRLSEDNGSSLVPLLHPGHQLDPGVNGGWNHVFKVHNCLTKEFGDNPNNTNTINQTTTTNTGYYLTLNPCDSFGPWLNTEKYGAGAYATLDNKTYETNPGQVNTSVLPPSERKSVWSHSLFYERQLSVENTFNTDDPYEDDYSETATYIRGVGYDTGIAISTNPIDYDDGSGDLGLTDPSNPYIADASKISPEDQPTYVALRRFLSLLGYAESSLNEVLKPTNWSSRNIEVASLGELDPEDVGYAASVGNWPVEFNRPSFIWCESMLWDYPGHLNYSKGLPQYRKSQLSQELQRDCEISEIWGGRVVATGLTIDGDLINYRVTNA